MHYTWEQLADGVSRCRLPFLDVTIGLVVGDTGVLLVDTGTTLVEARAIEADMRTLTGGRPVTDIVLTHYHFDHVLGASAFDGAVVHAAPEVADEMATGGDRLHAHAVQYEADAAEVAEAVAAMRVPDRRVDGEATIDLGGRTVRVWHPGRGHTTHDLVVTVDAPRPVLFCGDLVEESGDPLVHADSDLAQWPATLEKIVAAGGPDARYVPGHGAVVDAEFLARQGEWLRHHLAS